MKDCCLYKGLEHILMIQIYIIEMQMTLMLSFWYLCLLFHCKFSKQDNNTLFRFLKSDSYTVSL